MPIIPLSPEHEHLYCVCLEDWSDELKEGGDHKAKWLRRWPPEACGSSSPSTIRERSEG